MAHGPWPMALLAYLVRPLERGRARGRILRFRGLPSDLEGRRGAKRMIREGSNGRERRRESFTREHSGAGLSLCVGFHTK